MGSNRLQPVRRGQRSPSTNDLWAWGLGGAALAATLLALHEREREQQRLREVARRVALLANFKSRWDEYDGRLHYALASSARVVIDPTFFAVAWVSWMDAVRSVVGSVHQQITWTADRETCGEEECWQSPSVTAVTRRGDCEDLAILSLYVLRALGIWDFRVVVGLAGGQGHAWLEALDGPLMGIFADPTSGVVSLGRPAHYEPALFLGGAVPLVASLAA